MKKLTDYKISSKFLALFLTAAFFSVAASLIGVLYILSLRQGGTQYLAGVILVAAVTVAGLTVTFLFSRAIAKTILQPMISNQMLADRIGTGNLDTSDVLARISGGKHASSLDRKDELGDFTRSFKTMINKVRDSVNTIKVISEGDLTANVAITSDKDQLGNGLRNLLDNFEHLVSAIVTITDQVASGAFLVSESSQTLSQGATMQASSIQQLTAALSEIASQTNLNAKNAEKANEFAKQARENAAAGNAHMGSMLTAMDDISASSSSIGRIIKVIDDIAFQTNILALNAAVEAARAGQHGKGFAVVAEEVRSLAARSANAAKETTDLIEGTVRKVETGTKITRATADALGQIVTQVGVAADLVSSIAQASNEQATAIEQINSGILQVSQIVSTNAATSQESAAASEELSSQAAQLQEAVSVFKLRSSGIQIHAAGGSRDARPGISKNRLGARASAPAGNQAKRTISLGTGEFGKY